MSSWDFSVTLLSWILCFLAVIEIHIFFSTFSPFSALFCGSQPQTARSDPRFLMFLPCVVPSYADPCGKRNTMKVLVCELGGQVRKGSCSSYLALLDDSIALWEVGCHVKQQTLPVTVKAVQRSICSQCQLWGPRKTPVREFFIAILHRLNNFTFVEHWTHEYPFICIYSFLGKSRKTGHYYIAVRHHLASLSYWRLS